MQSDEYGFLLRFSVRAEIPSALLDDDDFDERSSPPLMSNASTWLAVAT